MEQENGISANENFSLDDHLKIIELNEGLKNFVCKFSVESLEKKPFFMCVVDEDELNDEKNDQELKFVRIDEKYSFFGDGEIDYKGPDDKTFLLCLRSDSENKVNVKFMTQKLELIEDDQVNYRSLPPDDENQPQSQQVVPHSTSTTSSAAPTSAPSNKQETKIFGMNYWYFIILVLFLVGCGILIFYFYKNPSSTSTSQSPSAPHPSRPRYF